MRPISSGVLGVILVLTLMHLHRDVSAIGCPASAVIEVRERSLSTESAVILYDQTDSPGSEATPSQDFEKALDAYDCFAGDDFTIPPGEVWDITYVEVEGIFYHGSGQIREVNVWFHVDDGGLPGAPVYSGVRLIYSPGPDGDLVIGLLPQATLHEGVFWLIVQVEMNSSQWAWQNRVVASNSPAAWRNPGGGFGVDCSAWAYRAINCEMDPGAPDQLFRLTGVRQQTTPAQPTTWGLIKAIYR